MRYSVGEDTVKSIDVEYEDILFDGTRHATSIEASGVSSDVNWLYVTSEGVHTLIPRERVVEIRVGFFR